MSSKILFISHSSKDKVILDEFIDLIITGCGLLREQIFCSSIEGYGIPTGENSVDFMKSKMHDASLTLFMISPAFLDSDFCKYEIGGAWINSVPILPLVIPPLTASKVKLRSSFFTNIQLSLAIKDAELDNIRDIIIKTYKTDSSTANWNKKRDRFIKNVGFILQKQKVTRNSRKKSNRNTNTDIGKKENPRNSIQINRLSGFDQENQDDDKKNKLRKDKIPVGGISLDLPCYFPSISSLKTQLTPSEYLTILNTFNYPLFLISAYDINGSTEQDREQIETILKRSIKSQQTVLLDSGYFESSWKDDSNWKPDSYWNILNSDIYSLAFSFDKPEDDSDFIDKSEKILINEIEGNWLKDQEKANYGSIIPIVHAKTEMIPSISLGVVQRVRPIMIAIPERELGDGVLEVAESIYRLRTTLNETGEYYPIHLLGAGYPLSILIYTACGADSFDSLEWCQTAIDPNSAMPQHFNHFDLLSDRSTIRGKQVPYRIATLMNNLIFYKKFMQSIKEAISNGSMENLLTKYLPPTFLSRLSEKIPELF